MSSFAEKQNLAESTKNLGAIKTLFDSISKANAPKKLENNENIDPHKLFKENDFAKKIVSSILDDSLKNGIIFEEDNEENQNKISELGLLEKIYEAGINGNVDGGCVLLLVTDRTESLGSLSREMGENEKIISLNILMKDEFESIEVNGDIYSNSYYKPEYYNYKNKEAKVKIHHSRVIVFNGRKLTKKEYEANKYWHESMLSKEIIKSVQAASRANEAISEAIEKLKKEVLTLSSFFDLMLSSDLGFSEIENTVKKIFENIDNKNRVVLDSDSTLTTLGVSLSGYGDVFDKILEYLCALTDLPRQKLLAAPSGSSISENAQGDQELYYDRVYTYQTRILRPIIVKILKHLEIKNPNFSFQSLFQKTDLDRAEESNKAVEFEERVVDVAMKINQLTSGNKGIEFWEKNTKMVISK